MPNNRNFNNRRLEQAVPLFESVIALLSTHVLGEVECFEHGRTSAWASLKSSSFEKGVTVSKSLEGLDQNRPWQNLRGFFYFQRKALPWNTIHGDLERMLSETGKIHVWGVTSQKQWILGEIQARLDRIEGRIIENPLKMEISVVDVRTLFEQVPSLTTFDFLARLGTWLEDASCSARDRQRVLISAEAKFSSLTVRGKANAVYVARNLVRARDRVLVERIREKATKHLGVLCENLHLCLLENHDSQQAISAVLEEVALTQSELVVFHLENDETKKLVAELEKRQYQTSPIPFITV